MKTENKYEYVVKVGGMMCEHCASHVKEALSKIKGVSSVVVSLQDKTAKVTSSKEIDEASFKEAIAEADYDYLGCSLAQ